MRTYTVALKGREEVLTVDAEHIIHTSGLSVFTQYNEQGEAMAVAEVPTADIAFVTSVVKED